MDENSDELRKKLAVLEGGKRAFQEATQATIQKNADHLAHLRREQKRLQSKLKALKQTVTAPKHIGAGLGHKGVASMEQRVCEQIKKHNRLKDTIVKKTEEIKQAQIILDLTEHAVGTVHEKNEDGIFKRDLENQLDKAIIKTHEAQHVATTYQAIIAKLVEDRETYDDKIRQMEALILARRNDTKELEFMCADAIHARDAARKELAQVEAETHTSRKERETRKLEMDREAEERRRHYEAMDRKRNNYASSNGQSAGDTQNEEVTDETSKKMMTYEEAMRKIQEVTGVTDMREVLARFSSQGETQERLEGLKNENAKTLANLRDQCDKITKQMEQAKYSGEARNVGNQRLLQEFTEQSRIVDEKLTKVKQAEIAKMRLLVDVKTGIENLCDKLNKIPPVEFETPNTTNEKLKEAELRLTKLLGEIEAKSVDLNAADKPSITEILPKRNLRITLAKEKDNDPVEEESDSEDDDIISRDNMKRQVQSLVDSKNKKPRKKKKGSRG